MGVLTRRGALHAAFGAIPFVSACATPARRAAATPFKCAEFIRGAAGLTPESAAPPPPGATGLVLNLVDRARSPDTGYDAVVEYWFESEAAYLAAAAPAGVLSAGFTPDQVMALTTREVVIRALAPGRAAPRAKRIGLVGARPDMAQAEFFRDWVELHAPPVDRQPGLERYVLNLLTHERSPDSPWDGYAELWWTDWEAYESARAFIRAGLQQRLDFFHAHELLLVQEHVIVAPR